MSEKEETVGHDMPRLLEEHPELKAALDAGDFQRAFSVSENKSLELPTAYWVELGQKALQKGKYVFARTALSRVSDNLHQQSQLYLREAARLYEQRSYDDAARQLGYAAVLFPEQSYPIPFQYMAWQLHERCNPSGEGTCLFEQPTLDSVRVGLSYLAGGTKIIAEFEQQISAHGHLAHLVLPLGSFWDKRQGDYLKRFREIVPALGGAQAPDLEEFQSELLGRKLPDPFAEIYFREICSFHPLMALLLCKKAVGRRIVLRPLILDGDTIVNFYENPKPLTEAVSAKKPPKK